MMFNVLQTLAYQTDLRMFLFSWLDMELLCVARNVLWTIPKRMDYSCCVSI